MDVNVALFFHICGVLTLFGSALLEITSLLRMRAARSVAEARSWAGVNKPLEVTFPIAVVLLASSGLYMLHNNPDFKSPQPWAMVVLVLLIVLAILGAVFHGRSLAAIAEGLAHAPQGAIPREIDAQIHNPLLLTSISSMSFAILGAVALMTVKPGLRDAIIVVAVSLILGAGVGQFVARREETAEVPEVALG
jgi:uncharacterized protein YneF (UPF0154 family)